MTAPHILRGEEEPTSITNKAPHKKGDVREQDLKNFSNLSEVSKLGFQ